MNTIATQIPACPPSTAAAVANEFITLGLNEPGVPHIDQMKLQKLLFYSHGWYLANYNAPLFEEDFEAWPWGPVVRDVYFQTREFGRGVINGKISTLGKMQNGNFGFITPDGVSGELKNFIMAVWASLKDYSGIQLSNATHAPGEPWTIIKDQYGGDLRHKPTIPNELIASVFKKKLENVGAS